MVIEESEGLISHQFGGIFLGSGGLLGDFIHSSGDSEEKFNSRISLYNSEFLLCSVCNRLLAIRQASKQSLR